MNLARRSIRLAAVLLFASLVAPPAAWAIHTERSTEIATFIVGIVALVVAVVLLLDVLALRRVAEGAAIADNMAYVMAGVVCLVAAVVLGWVARYLPSVFSEAQGRLGADVLIVACMFLFGVYFYRVRRVLTRYLNTYSGDELLAHAHEGGIGTATDEDIRTALVESAPDSGGEDSAGE